MYVIHNNYYCITRILVLQKRYLTSNGHDNVMECSQVLRVTHNISVPCYIDIEATGIVTTDIGGASLFATRVKIAIVVAME